jgi:hypothetical protein
MSTTTTAASNGGTDITAEASDAAGPKDKPFGMAVIREAETYHNATMLRDAVAEADDLARTIQQAVSDAHFRDIRTAKVKAPGLTATQTAESAQTQAKVQEVLNCLQAAQDYVNRLLVNTYHYDESPF